MAWRGMHRNMRDVKPIMARMLGAVLVLSMLSGCGDKARVEESSAEGSSMESSMVASDAAERNADGTEESGAMDTEQKDIVTELLNQMTLEEKVGQMMVASFRVWQDLSGTASDAGKTVESQELVAVSERVNVTELNDTIRECIQKNHIGGTILFAENFKNAEQTLRLVMDLQTSSIKGGGVPLFVAVDQEGGSVARIGFGTTGVGNMALAATADSDNAKAMAKIYGTELQALGINMDYAPVLFISAKTGQRVDKLFPMINTVAKNCSNRITTGTLNDVLNEAVTRVQPPTDRGKRLKIYYMTQTGANPPTFVIFCNNAELFHFSYQRYIENKLREVFGFEGTPIKLIIRERGDDVK